MHNLDNTTGEWACFTAGTPAWHGLGVNIAEAQTSAEAIKLAKQDWTVSKRQLFYDDAIGKRTIPDRFATVRDDVGSPLGVVSADYSVFQNAEAFNFMDSLVGDKLAMFHSAGALDGGKKVWMLAQLPEQYRIAKDDIVHPYMLMATSHDGSMSIKCFPTSVRVVCQNTLSYALLENSSVSKRQGVSIRHDGKIGPRIETAKLALRQASEAGKRFEREANAMAARKLTSAESKDFFEGLFPVRMKIENRLQSPYRREWTGVASLLDSIIETQSARADVGKELLEAHYAENERQAKANRQILDQVLRNYENRRNNLAGIEHSAWSAYNAVSEWVDHSKTYRGKTSTDRAESRFESIIYGAADGIKQEAYGAALALAK